MDGGLNNKKKMKIVKMFKLFDYVLGLTEDLKDISHDANIRGWDDIYIEDALYRFQTIRDTCEEIVNES
jgi:hypothetical protein